MSGHLLFVLHGHLPFVCHPEHEFFLEEDWFFEAVADCYLPLLKVLDGWKADRVDAAFTLGLSPPLLHMLGTPLLRERTVRYLEGRRTLARRGLETRPVTSPFRPALAFAQEEAEWALERFETAERDLAFAFAEHHAEGRVELMTCGATHGLLPVLLDEQSCEAQIAEAVATHERFLSTRPRGIWLPECGVTPLVLDVLARHNLAFTFCEDRALRFANPAPVRGTGRPLYSPEGVAFFARDPEAAREVWSADEGYPGDGRYREFYRDLGYDAEETLLDPVHKQGTGDRKNTGVKLHRITGVLANGRRAGLDDKQPYDPEAAEAAAESHARHFCERRIEQAQRLRESIGVEPALVCSFDAELFGHWWHEGPWFLDQAVRNLVAHPQAPTPVSASQYLELEPTHQVATPAVSSWGEEGTFKVWVNPTNDWLWRKVHDARLRLSAAVDKGAQGEWQHRALLQATREVLLAQSSDWPFILSGDTQVGYGKKRPLIHLSRAHRLLTMLENDAVDEKDLSQIEERDAVFIDVDPSRFASRA